VGVLDGCGPLFQVAAGEATERTLYRNASMTKAVATTGALQLVEQGRLSLLAHCSVLTPSSGGLK
jgi:methyl acetate hydrolase